MIRARVQVRRSLPPQVPSAVDFRSETICERLDKIAGHYDQLQELLAALENRLPSIEVPAESKPADANDVGNLRKRKPR